MPNTPNPILADLHPHLTALPGPTAWQPHYEQLLAYLAEAQQAKFPARPQSLPSAKTLLALPVAERSTLLLAIDPLYDLLERGNSVYDYRLMLLRLQAALLKSKEPLTADTLTALLQRLHSSIEDGFLLSNTDLILKALEHFAATQELTPPLRQTLQAIYPLTAELERFYYTDYKAVQALRPRCQQLLQGPADSFPLNDEELWAAQARDDLKALPASERSVWLTLLTHAGTASSTRPSAKWLKTAAQSVQAIGAEALQERLALWFALVGREPGESGRPRLHNREIHPHNIPYLKGLVWTSSLLGDAAAGMLGELGELCIRKIYGVGPRCALVGNACINSLGTIGERRAIAQLNLLKQKVRYSNIARLVDRTLEQLASARGLTPADLAELTLPDYGLAADGVLRQAFGDYKAEWRIDSISQTSLHWYKPDGSPQKSVPADVKSQHGAALKAFNATVKELPKVLLAQRDRLERLLMTDQRWTYADWRERYLAHPLLRALATRLLWHIRSDGQTTVVLPQSDELLDEHGATIPAPADSASIGLWHPLEHPADSVLRWRRLLEHRRIVQPFKQAHREVYLLTDAERQTDTYSNRFAAHILNQSQFAALCRQRDWAYTVEGGWDGGGYGASRSLPGDLSADYWTSGLRDGDYNASGICTHIVTDQVRFYRGRQQLRLETVPARIFSEVLRDVDLFVGVASVGNDPAWSDRGEQRNYWQSYAFGELSETAHTRREVLTFLLPKLKIAAQCELGERFLQVQGKLRTYKIHLGSGNILMMPNDQYLCIVADASATQQKQDVFLPFDGDRTLALILSKAFLLAEDHKIKDPTILSQIRLT